MKNAQAIAKLLLEIKAVTLNFQTPYRFTSGILSPIYCDNRVIISHPKKREQVIDAFLSVIQQNQLELNAVAGVATAGIAHAAWIADRLALPLVYVRGAAKAHGKHNQIEGELQKNAHALLVEDLISTGNSALAAGSALRAAGSVVSDCVAIFSYQLKASKDLFQQANIRLYTLSNFAALLDVAVDTGYITETEKSQALVWQENPSLWGIA